MALVSVITPTYKTSGNLIESIESVLAQTYKDVEVIVIDDNDPSSGYRSKTEALMAKYDHINNVVYIKHQSNKNGAAARNTGIKASKGEFIAFLDDDDTFLPDKLEKQLNYLESHPEMDAVYGFVQIDGQAVVTHPYEGNAVIPLLCERTRMFTSALMFRREAIDAIGGFDESFRRHQDFELMIKFFLHGFKVGCIQEVVTDYKAGGGNHLHGKALENLKDKYLLQFESAINELEVQKKGTKKKIIANNYASLFVSYMVSRDFKCALRMLRKYFYISPLDFMSYMWFFTRNQIKKRF